MSRSVRLLRVACADHDVACPWCGYNLRGQPFREDVPRCPECGKRLFASVTVGKGAEPREPGEADRALQKLRSVDMLLTLGAVIVIAVVILVMIVLLVR